MSAPPMGKRVERCVTPMLEDVVEEEGVVNLASPRILSSPDQGREERKAARRSVQFGGDREGVNWARPIRSNGEGVEMEFGGRMDGKCFFNQQSARGVGLM
jgi:hypothetical protein